MKKFGFGRKQADGDDDPNRSALFGKKGSSGPPLDNPYAQTQPANDPYATDNNKFANMTPYQQVRARVPDRSVGGLPNGPSPQNGYGAPPLGRNDTNSSSATAPPPYPNAQASSGYANDRYGTSSGYGTSKYSNANGYGASTSRPGGYGGLGRTDSNDTDANRDALFSGAQERYNQRQTDQESGAYDAPGADADASKYGGYGEQRELTEEEREEAEVGEIKGEIKREKLATAQTAENTARIGQQTVELASQTLARLGAQAERLNNTESLIDRGSFSSREAEEQTKKLRSLNRSMFAVHVSNPFTAKKRTAEMEQRVLDQNRADRELRESTRKDGFVGNQRMETAFRQVEASKKDAVWQRPSAAEKSKYTFEDDDEDEEVEERIDSNMESTAKSVSQLKTLAHLLGDEIDSQNKVIDRIGNKSDKLNDATAVQVRRLQNIR
ncbi:Protein transport protein S9 plasma membrane t-SNARE [Parahypoxylon ruwenzoriense]